MLIQCWHIIEDGGQTLNQHWIDLMCLLGGDLRQVGFHGPCVQFYMLHDNTLTL